MYEDSTLEKKMMSSINGNGASEFWKVEHYLEGNLAPNTGPWGGFWRVIFSSDSSWFKAIF